MKTESIIVWIAALGGAAILINAASAKTSTPIPTPTPTPTPPCTANNNIKIHVDEYDRSDPNGIYDILRPSANANIIITDYKQNILSTINTDDSGNACLVYDNRYIVGTWYAATVSKYGYMSDGFSALQSFQIPIKEINNLSLYRIYVQLPIGINI